MKQLSCKRKQKWWTRSIRKISSPAGRAHSHTQTNNSCAALIGWVRQQPALPRQCRMFLTKQDVFQQSTRQRKQARIDLNARPLKGINLPSTRLLLRRLELELQRFEHERGGRQLDCIHAESIHLQNYVHIGIDVIPQLQSFCPDAKVMKSLHEYPALCMHNGPMVTTEQLKLCEKTTPLACSMCFPEHNTSSLFLKHHYIKTILESIDALINPSKFLIDRYRDCGIDHPRFYMLENDLPAYLSEERRPATSRPIPRSSTAFSSSVSLISTRARWCSSRRPTSCRRMGSQIHGAHPWFQARAPAQVVSGGIRAAPRKGERQGDAQGQLPPGRHRCVDDGSGLDSRPLYLVGEFAGSDPEGVLLLPAGARQRREDRGPWRHHPCGPQQIQPGIADGTLHRQSSDALRLG